MFPLQRSGALVSITVTALAGDPDLYVPCHAMCMHRIFSPYLFRRYVSVLDSKPDQGNAQWYANGMGDEVGLLCVLLLLLTDRSWLMYCVSCAGRSYPS